MTLLHNRVREKGRGGGLHPLVLGAALLLLAVVPGCGDDADFAEPAPAGPDVVEDVPAAYESSLVGLEVAAAGNVTEVISPIAFRIDKDGTGREGAPRFGDDEFGDGPAAEEGVLILDVRETGVELGAGVRVTGTVREFDLPEAELVFDVELDDGVYGTFHDELVIVADEVARAAGSGEDKAAGAERQRTDRLEGPAASLVGLQVTAYGNVTEVIDLIAFRLDKDGVGEDERATPFDDEVFGDVEIAERPVLVLGMAKTQFTLGSPVRVTGTVRELDLPEVERIFDVDLEERLYRPFERELVIFADEVTNVGGSSSTMALRTSRS